MFFWPTVPVWSCGQFPFHFSLSLFFSLFTSPAQQLPSFIMLFSISSPFCSSGLTAYFVSYFSHLLSPFPSPLFLLKSFLILSLLLLVPLNALLVHLLSFSFPVFHQLPFLFSIFSCLPHFVSSSRCSFSYSFFLNPFFFSIFIQSLLSSKPNHIFSVSFCALSWELCLGQG